MPHEQMTEQQVAQYLHMDTRELEKLASRKEIPCRKTDKGYVFRKSDVDHWVEVQMHTLSKEHLKGIEKGVSKHHGFKRNGLLVWPMIPKGGVVCPLKAKTHDAVIRGLVKIAEDAGLVYSRDAMVAEIRGREELCSTAMIPGVALPHPRHPLPYDIERSFVVVGKTASGVPFGSADGSLTRLFFLICCKDDRTHLHVLARIAQMLHDPKTVNKLLETETNEELGQMLLALEENIKE